MRKIIIILFTLPALLYAQETTIGNLTRVSAINDSDALVVEQADSTRKMYFSDLIGGVLDSVVITSFDGTANRFFVTDASGNVTEITFGTAGQVLTSNGAILAPSFQDATEGGASGDYLPTLLVADDTVNLQDNNLFFEYVDGAFESTSMFGRPSGAGFSSYVTDGVKSSQFNIGAQSISFEVHETDGTDKTTIRATTLGIFMRDGQAETGVMYDDDYSANGLLNNRWIPDIAAVRSEISDSIAGLAGASYDSIYIHYRVDSLATIVDDTISFVFEDGLTATEGTGTVTITWDSTAVYAAIAEGGGASYDSIYIHYRVDSLSTELNTLKAQLDVIYAALGDLGIDAQAPTVVSIEIGTYNDSIFVVLLDTTDVHQDSIPLASDFYITEDGSEFGVNAVTISDDTVFIAMDSVGVYGSTYLVDYTSGTPALQDSSGNLVASWSDKSVTNNVEEISVGDYIAEYQSVYNQFSTPPQVDTSEYFNAFVDSLVTNGYWTDSIDFVYVFANNNSTDALINWRTPTGTTAAIQGSPTFTRYQGFNAAGDNTTDYIDLRWNPTDDGINWVQNSAFFGIYSLTNNEDALYDFGFHGSGVDAMMRLKAGDNLEWLVNGGTVENEYRPGGITNGFFIASRTASDLSTLYINGVSADTDAEASQSPPTGDFQALQANGRVTNTSTRRLSLVIGGAGISAYGANKINAWIEQLHDNLGIGQQD
jgi:hypothetical protein